MAKQEGPLWGSRPRAGGKAGRAEPGRGPDWCQLPLQVINGLRQRVFKLEQQCKEKDSTIK